MEAFYRIRIGIFTEDYPGDPIRTNLDFPNGGWTLEALDYGIDWVRFVTMDLQLLEDVLIDLLELSPSLPIPIKIHESYFDQLKGIQDKFSKEQITLIKG